MDCMKIKQTKDKDSIIGAYPDGHTGVNLVLAMQYHSWSWCVERCTNLESQKQLAYLKAL